MFYFVDLYDRQGKMLAKYNVITGTRKMAKESAEKRYADSLEYRGRECHRSVARHATQDEIDQLAGGEE